MKAAFGRLLSFMELGIMTTVSIRYSNASDRTLLIQVEPWASLYRLKKGDQIRFIAESETCFPEFELKEDGDVRYLTILHSSGFFVELNGKRIPWTDYPNIVGRKP